MDIDLNKAALRQFIDYYALMTIWNKRFNLTSVPNGQWAARHFLDSLSVFPYIKKRKCADLGSGAGLPGIPLAIAGPTNDWTLIEKSYKKATFLQRVQQTLQLTNVSVIDKRAQEYAGEMFSCVVVRALASSEQVRILAEPLLEKDGELIIMGGKKNNAEEKKLKKQDEQENNAWGEPECHIITVPFLNAERHLEVWRKL